jgi:hypothetical protein
MSHQEFIIWFVCIFLADLLSAPIAFIINEAIKHKFSKYGWFKDYKATLEMEENIEKMLIRMSKKSGYKRKAKQALAIIQEVKEEQQEAKNE